MSSPRFASSSTPLASLLIHGSIAALLITLVSRFFLFDGLSAWSVGVAYVGYDTALLGLVFCLTLPLAKTARPATPRDAAPLSVGVIIAAHNEATVLPATLKALFAQSEPADVIVIADDGSTDATAALLEERFGLLRPDVGALSPPSARHPTLYWLRLLHGKKPAALNCALMQIATDIVFTVDADTLLERNAVAAMRDAFANDDKLVAATGILTPVCAPTSSGRIMQWFQTYEYIRNFLSRYAWMQMQSLLLISGAFAAFRRTAVMTVGGFDSACLVEDYELIHRLHRFGARNGLGWTTRVVGASRAMTEAPGTASTFLRQRRRWFGGFLQTQFWYRDMVGNRNFGLLGLVMLPIKAADALQPIYGLMAFALLMVSLLSGRWSLVGAAAGVIGAKIFIDLSFYLWSIHLFRRWAQPCRKISFAAGLLVALCEPFSFQILRHLGAAWGWIMFLTGERNWGVQRRVGLVAIAAEVRREARD